MRLSRLKIVDMPLHVGAVAVYNASDAIETKLTLEDRNNVPFKLYERVGRFDYVARELAPVPSLFDKRVRGLRISVPQAPPPRDNQVQIFADTLTFLRNHESGVVHAYTGWGKTYLGAHVIHGIGRKTLVVVTKDDVFKQWVTDTPRLTGLSPDAIGVIRGDKCEVKGKSVVVAMIHSVCKLDRYTFDELRAEEFGLVIFDEVQRLPADEFSRCAGMFPALLRLGLTAESKRSDGRDILIQAHIGPVRIETKASEERNVPKIIRLKSSWRCPRVLNKEKKSIRLPHSIGRTAHIEKFMIDDPDRNSLIVDCITAALPKGRQVVVFSSANRHLVILRDMLIAEGVAPDDIGYYIHEATKKGKAERELNKAKPVVLTNYKMAGEGTNVLSWDTCVFAIPRANVRQPVGRIRRENEGKLQPVVIDIVDGDSLVFTQYAASRKAWYASINAEIVEM